MEKVQVLIGHIESLKSGVVEDNTRPVEFVAEEIGRRTTYGEGRGGLTDTRGITETLYRTEDGRLVIHVEEWSRWQGEPTTSHLREVTEKELQVGGVFEQLGREVGYARALTLEEALTTAPAC